MFKLNNKGTRMSMTSGVVAVNFEQIFHIVASTVDFKKVNAGLVTIKAC